MRGDGLVRSTTTGGHNGSPPRAWGRRRDGRSVRLDVRFTPTCVGTALAVWALHPVLPVHPHVRGDGSPSTGVLNDTVGSPPRAWGRRRSRRPPVGRRRFTPTCVGTAPISATTCRATTVHPHVRGDGNTYGLYGCVPDGSPPRAWGRRCVLRATQRGDRFTPTCVGTARPVQPLCSESTVHPHVRRDGGSAHGLELPCRRFTPTCVGTAEGSPTSASVGTAPTHRRCPAHGAVHPHVRGDGADGSSTLGFFNGSPPRAWGRRVQIARDTPAHRFTPTCVGTAPNVPAATARHSVHPHVRGDGSSAAWPCCAWPVHPHVRGDG